MPSVILKRIIKLAGYGLLISFVLIIFSFPAAFGSQYDYRVIPFTDLPNRSYGLGFLSMNPFNGASYLISDFGKGIPPYAYFIKPTSTSDQELPSSNLDLECLEMVSIFEIDKDIANQLVPDEYELDLQGDFVVLILVIQDCENTKLNGKNVGSLELTHCWIAIKGPFDIEPVPGANETYPTFYWYSVLEQTTSNKLIGVLNRIGISEKKVEKIVLAPWANERTGEVVEHGGKTYETQVGYRWWEMSNEVIPPDIIGINHRVVHKSGNNGRIGKLCIQCLIARNGLGKIAVEIDPESELGTLLQGQVLSGETWDFNMSCHAIAESLWE